MAIEQALRAKDQMPGVASGSGAGDVVLPRKVVVAGFISTFIEWYDFLVYGTVAALVFNQLFFPKLDSMAGTLATLSTFAVGFLARPLGGIIFGHFGDRVGRKKMLIMTLLIMAIATTGIGLLPSYDQIGIWAPILLVFCRFMQGISVGGEWGGVALLLMEQSPVKRRGFNGSWAQIGGYLGPLAGTSVIAIVASFTTAEEFLAWGWRVPFLLSIALFVVGMYVRVTMGETPVFARAKKTKMPLASVFKENTSTVLGIIGVHGAEAALLFVALVYVPGYLKNTAGFAVSAATTAVVAMLVAATVATMFGGWLSDYIGRVKVTAAGLIVGILVAFPLFWSAGTGSPLLVYLAMITAGISIGLVYGPEPAFFGELFPTKHRYSGISIGAQLGAVIGGATAPILATLLLGWTGGTWGVSVLVIVWQIVGLFGLAVLGETRGRDLDF